MNKFHYAIIIFLVFVSILSVYFFIPSEDSFMKRADEGYYFIFASRVAERGLSQFPALIKSYASNTELHLYPPPSRVGHILLTALWLKLFGYSFVNLARFSFFCYVLFILVCFYFSLKLFGRDLAFPFALLSASSPLVMAMGKRAHLDSNANLFWALCIWIFLGFLITKKKSKFIIFLIVYSVCISIKESSAFLLVFFVMYFLIHKYYFKNAISNNYLLGIIFIPPILIGISYLVLFGGFYNFLSLIKGLLDTHFGSVKFSQYAVLFCTGPWYRYIIDYLLLSPVTTLLFLGYLGYILISRKWEDKILYFFLYFITVFGIFSNLKYSKVVRFVINLDMVISLFSVFMLYELFRQKNKRYQTYFVLMGVIVIFFVNYHNFLYLFCNRNIYDPVSYWLLQAKKIIPYQ